MATAPSAWFARDGDAWYDGEPSRADALADGVASWSGVDRGAFHTGSDRYDAEWRFGAHMMAAMGFGQLALAHPDHRAAHLAQMDACLDKLVGPDLAAFDTEAWGQSPWDALDGDDGHAAFYGYTALPLALRREIAPGSRFDATEERLIAGLARRFAAADGLIATYPGERYAVDNAAGIGAIGLHDAATGEDHGAVVKKWEAMVHDRLIDRSTGLLAQSATADGRIVDGPRGSGTALAAYFLSWADPALSRSLWGAMRAQMYGGPPGFGAMREYPPGVFGLGDIDSGPVIFGYGVSSTGFSLAGARLYGDRAVFRRLYATTALFGAPQGDHFATGGPLGDAILFAMLTAPRGEGP